MKVSAQYAETHLAELLSAAKHGEDVEIEQSDKNAFRLTLVPQPPRKTIPLWGAAAGKICIAEDFDSDEVNQEIAEMFNGSDNLKGL